MEFICQWGSIEQIADLNMLRAETHKFESHYVDNLVGKSTMTIQDTSNFVGLLFHLVLSLSQLVSTGCRR